MIVYTFSPAPHFIKISESKMGWVGGDTMWIADGRIKQRLYTNNAGSGLCNK